jgi:uncharacterized protein YggU (UPF0235/DUF167 family)
MLKAKKAELSGHREIYLTLRVRASAGRSGFKERMADGAYKFDVLAAPEKNKANQEIITYLAREFGVKPARIKIVSGRQCRVKLIKISYERFMP